MGQTETSPLRHELAELNDSHMKDVIIILACTFTILGIGWYVVRKAKHKENRSRHEEIPIPKRSQPTVTRQKPSVKCIASTIQKPPFNNSLKHKVTAEDPNRTSGYTVTVPLQTKTTQDPTSQPSPQDTVVEYSKKRVD